MDQLNEFVSGLSNQISSVLPDVLGALLVFIIGLFVASGVRRLIAKLLRSTSLDERVNRGMKTKINFEKVLSKLAYYLVLLFVVLLVLDILGVNSVLDPLEGMLSKFSGHIPNIIIAGLVGFAGFILARIASEAVGLIAGALEDFSAKIGWKGSVSIETLVKQLVFLFVFIPLLIVALDYLKMYSITRPATEMLNMLITSIPQFLYAVAILGVFYFVGRYVINIAVELMKNVGVDDLANNMQIDDVVGQRSIAKIIGDVLFFFLMFVALISAADKLGLDDFSTTLDDLMRISGKIVFGIIILLFGNFISIHASNMVSGDDQKTLRTICRYAILIIFLAMALHTMGIAPSIVNLAFGLTLGAIAVATALAFGLGGREAAGKHLDHLLTKWRKND